MGDVTQGNERSVSSLLDWVPSSVLLLAVMVAFWLLGHITNEPWWLWLTLIGTGGVSSGLVCERARRSRGGAVSTTLATHTP